MHVTAISISDRKGIRKKNIDMGNLLENFGLAGDAHGGNWHRQVSLLAQESIDTMRAKGLDVVAGNFAENITTTGIDLSALRVGEHVAIGPAELVISQLGKVCHHRCAIFHQAGDCVMPREGIFAVVRKAGCIRVGDEIRVMKRRSAAVAVICSAAAEKTHGAEITARLMSRWAPSVIRFDQLNGREDNMRRLLDDLTGRQGIDTILIFDPTGLHFPSADDQPVMQGDERQRRTVIHYCRSADEITQLRPKCFSAGDR